MLAQAVRHETVVTAVAVGSRAFYHGPSMHRDAVVLCRAAPLRACRMSCTCALSDVRLQEWLPVVGLPEIVATFDTPLPGIPVDREDSNSQDT